MTREMKQRKLNQNRTRSRSAVIRKLKKYKGSEQFFREDYLSIYEILKQKKKLMDDQDKQILNRIREEEEIEDEYNTE